MKPYDSKSRCLKCGYDLVSSIYTEMYVEVEEAIERTCGRCGYQWYEACLDSEEENS